MPFSKFEPILAAHKKNGLDVSMTYGNDKGCAKLVSIIGLVIRDELALEIHHKHYLGLMIDVAFCKTGIQSID